MSIVVSGRTTSRLINGRNHSSKSDSANALLLYVTTTSNCRRYKYSNNKKYCHYGEFILFKKLFHKIFLISFYLDIIITYFRKKSIDIFGRTTSKQNYGKNKKIPKRQKLFSIFLENGIVFGIIPYYFSHGELVHTYIPHTETPCGESLCREGLTRSRGRPLRFAFPLNTYIVTQND